MLSQHCACSIHPHQLVRISLVRIFCLCLLNCPPPKSNQTRLNGLLSHFSFQNQRTVLENFPKLKIQVFDLKLIIHIRESELNSVHFQLALFRNDVPKMCYIGSHASKYLTWLATSEVRKVYGFWDFMTMTSVMTSSSVTKVTPKPRIKELILSGQYRSGKSHLFENQNIKSF